MVYYGCVEKRPYLHIKKYGGFSFMSNAKYAEILRVLKEESASFVNFLQGKEPRLESVKNEADMWERAMMLPFIYS